MADPDFDDGFDKGKRAVSRAAGWAAGMGAAALSPIARGAENVAKRTSQRIESKRQQEEQLRVAHQQRTNKLERLAESASLRPLHIGHILLTLLLAVILAVCASLSPSPNRWVGVAVWFAVGIVIGAVITWVARTQDIRRTRHDLRLHLNPGRTNAYVAVFLTVLVAAVCAIAAITRK